MYCRKQVNNIPFPFPGKKLTILLILLFLPLVITADPEYPFVSVSDDPAMVHDRDTMSHATEFGLPKYLNMIQIEYQGMEVISSQKLSGILTISQPMIKNILIRKSQIPSDNLIGILYDRSISLYQMESEPIILKEYLSDSFFETSAISQADNYIALGTSSGNIVLWQYRKNVFLSQDLHKSPITALGFNNNKSSPSLISGDEAGHIYVWNILARQSRCIYKHSGRITSLQFSSTGQFAVSSGSDGVVCCFDLQKNTQYLHNFHLSRVVDVAIIEEQGELFITSVSEDGMIMTWNPLKPDESIKIFRTPIPYQPLKLSYNTNREQLGCSFKDGSVLFLKSPVNQWKPESFFYHCYAALGLSSDVNGYWIIGTSDGQLFRLP